MLHQYPTETYTGYRHTLDTNCTGYGHTLDTTCTGYDGQQTRGTTDLYSNPANNCCYNYWPTFTTYQPNFIPGYLGTYKTGLSSDAWSRSSWQQPACTLGTHDAYFRSCAAPMRTDSWHTGVTEVASSQANVTYRDFVLPGADFRQADDVTTEPDSTAGFYQENTISPWTEIDKPGVTDAIPREDIFNRFLTSVLEQTPSKATPRKPTTGTCDVDDDKTGASRHGGGISRKRTRSKDDALFDTKTPKVKRAKTSEKESVCPVCSKVFTRRAALTVHARLHTGVRPYSCTDCSRSFADYSVYVRHRRTHTHERPYACPECGDRFTQSGNLLRHRRKQHMFVSRPSTRACDRAPVCSFYDTLGVGQ